MHIVSRGFAERLAAAVLLIFLTLWAGSCRRTQTHGDDQVLRKLSAAVSALERQDYKEAKSLSMEVLFSAPDHPLALEIAAISLRMVGDQPAAFAIRARQAAAPKQQLSAEEEKINERLNAQRKRFLADVVLRCSPEAMQYADMGGVSARAGRHEEAERYLTRAIQSSPNCEAPYFNRAILAYDRKDLTGAAAALGEVLRINPANEQARRMLASLRGGGASPTPPVVNAPSTFPKSAVTATPLFAAVSFGLPLGVLAAKYTPDLLDDKGDAGRREMYTSLLESSVKDLGIELSPTPRNLLVLGRGSKQYDAAMSWFRQLGEATSMKPRCLKYTAGLSLNSAWLVYGFHGVNYAVDKEKFKAEYVKRLDQFSALATAAAMACKMEGFETFSQELERVGRESLGWFERVRAAKPGELSDAVGQIGRTHADRLNSLAQKAMEAELRQAGHK